ncbi:MAG: helix-hairpin-helix domain-containing protein [Candidatus Eisenbacteria bacterium]|nr:helix-hairpin-helix domain-containing protein [Candidatus Eisenbacteria bacterium]
MVEALRARVDLNRDGAPALETLPGIGPKKARLIVEWREAHGPFRSLGDLDRVPGIGRKTIERIAPLVTIEDRTAGSEGGSASGGREADAGRETSGKDDGLGSRGSSSSLGASHSGAIPEAPEAEGVLGRSDG